MAFATIGTAGIQAQSIDLSTKVTGTLPVPNGGLGIASGTTGQFLKFSGTETLASSAVSAGITQYDEWLVTSSFTNDADPITSNWARNAANTFAYIGSGMSQSSGIFTFPVTGIYKVEFFGRMAQGSSDERDIAAYIQKTVNNSSYDEASATESSIYKGSGSWFQSFYQAATIDVTDTGQRKVRFKIAVNTSSTETQCSGTLSSTGAKFTRLGDT
mgnify:CR=1 FL=1